VVVGVSATVIAVVAVTVPVIATVTVVATVETRHALSLQLSLPQPLPRRCVVPPAGQGFAVPSLCWRVTLRSRVGHGGLWLA
jgi:hypothetical protein